MSDNPKDSKNLKQSISDLVLKIPGFKGYLAMSDRREADAQLRERLVMALTELQTRFMVTQKDLISKTGLTYMELSQSIEISLQTFIDKVRTAPRGYSSLFAAEKIDEKALEEIYQFDTALFGIVDRIGGLLSSISESIGAETTEQLLKDLHQEMLAANDMFNHREEIITGTAE